MKFRAFLLSFAAVTCLALAPAAHAIGDPGDLTGTPNSGPVDPPPSPDPGGTGVGDCQQSPECPTAVLAMLGMAGTGMGLRVRKGFKRSADAKAAAQA